MGHVRPLIYAQDPGGANLIAIIAATLLARHALDATAYWHPLAEQAFRRAGIAGTPLVEAVGTVPAGDEAIEGWMDRLRPTHLICTASSRHVDLTNARLIAAARADGIPSLTFLDHWVGFDRFQDETGRPAYLPDVTAVPDRYCQERVMAIGATQSQTPIVGHAHLEALARRGGAHTHDGPVRVLLVSQPVVVDRSFRGALFLDDGGRRAIDGIAETLAPSIDSGRIEVAYRPHPKERRTDHPPPGFAIDEAEGGGALLDRHDVFIGVTSMVLFEAAVARRAVIQLDMPSLRGAVAGDWPPYDAGVRIASLDRLPGAVDAAVMAFKQGNTPPGVPGLDLEGSLERSVALCESFLS